MHALAAACCTHGFAQLGSKLQLFADTLNINSNSGMAGSLIAQLGSSNNSSREQQAQRHVQFGGGAGHQQASSPVSKRAASLSGGVGVSGSLSYKVSTQQLQPGPPSHVSRALLHLMRPLCLQLSRALLPTFAEWLLRFWMGLLLLPGASALHPHVLLLLRCLFDTPGLQLGPAANLLLDPSFLSPMVALSQVSSCCIHVCVDIALVFPRYFCDE
jgi:hypothetical protein